ncbi:MAG: Zn-ribbon domain-containing OB-fold protein [Candidatus Kariarchaeaceae archaeon]
MSQPLLKDGIPYHIDKSITMKTYWDGLNENKLMTTSCEKCSVIHFPPAPQLCTNCFGTNMIWRELPLSGTISTWTRVTAPPEGFFGEYMLASVIVDELDKAILGRYVGENPTIGKRVKISFEAVNDQHVLIFE